MSQETETEIDIPVVSGINFPYLSRKYLVDLLADVVRKHKAPFVVVAGKIMAGKFLEAELRHYEQLEKERIKEFNKDAPRGKKIRFNEDQKKDIIQEFIEDKAAALNEFLPRLSNGDKQVNYHIVVAERIYDRPIGVAILQKLQSLRNDIRIFTDPEAKIPINLPGFEPMRVLVPRRTPWTYKNITGTMQRLIDAFVPRTFSPRPSMMVVGCTGTAATLPFYKGVPCFSVPDLHKIDEQLSTENMVGCLVLKVSSKNNQLRITRRVYDWRTAVYDERKYLITKQTSKDERVVMNALKPSTASLKAIVFSIHYYFEQKEQSNRKNRFTHERVKKILDRLVSKGLVVFNKEGNRYGINEEAVKKIKISLDDLLRDNRIVRHLVGSCFHIGALKTLYFTLIEDVYKSAIDADYFILNGDIIQGIHHNYEYNGELLPIANGYDKQNLLAAHIFERIVWKVFEERFQRNVGNNAKRCSLKLLKRCLLPLVLNLGNHDLWEVYSKNALALSLFEERFKRLLVNHISSFCSQQTRKINIKDIEELVNDSFIRVGEKKFINYSGIKVGLKHAHQGRTLSKSQRQQEVASWFEEQKRKEDRGVSIVYIANFHEAADIHYPIFGRTILGVMTGAELKDTQFEEKKNKVVDYGTAKVTVSFDKEGRLIFDEVEYDAHINPKDKAIVYSDSLTTADVNSLCQALSTQVVNLPWRYT